MIGQIFAGRYRVLHVLGAGGFGETYITADLHMPGTPQCVLKHLKPDTKDPEVLELARKLFQKEAETLQQLGSHPQIPRLLAFFEEKQEFYLVQEFIEGHTLSFEIISGQKWTEQGVRKMLQEVLTILDFVHSQGVIHRDIKPDNIMRRDSDGKLVLIDFGAIKQVRNQQFTAIGTAPQTIAIGTPGYMSPEQARGNPRLSSDLYALGVIAIQAISGKHPTEIQEDDATGELQWQQFVQASPDLVAYLSQMTRYHFRDRYPTASQAIQVLNQLESGDVTLPLPISPVVPAHNPTAATLVVSPALSPAVPQPVQTPSPRNTPGQDPRLDSPRRSGSNKLLLTVIGAGMLLGVSGMGGYLGWSYFKTSQFDSRLNTDQCRLAAPQGNGGTTTKVRHLPERNSGIKATLPPGEKFLYLSSQEPFVEIQQRDGSRGWVFNDQIDGCKGVSLRSTPTPTPQASSPKPRPSKSIDNARGTTANKSPTVTYSTAPMTPSPMTTPTTSAVTPTTTMSSSPTTSSTFSTPTTSSSSSHTSSPSVEIYTIPPSSFASPTN
jgi:serine/threonine protein kinase, bacterial